MPTLKRLAPMLTAAYTELDRARNAYRVNPTLALWSEVECREITFNEVNRLYVYCSVWGE